MALTIDSVSVNNNLDDHFTFGDFSETNLTKVKTLYANVASGSSKFYSTPREVGTTSGYVVPTGKRFIVTGYKLYFTGSANSAIAIQGATSDVGFQSASAPTGRHYGSADISNIKDSTATTESRVDSFMYEVPAGHYLHFYMNGSGSAIIFGREIDAAVS